MTMSRKKKLIIAGVAVAVVVAGFAIYATQSHGGGDFLTITELKAQGDSAMGRTLQVKGEVEYGSIQWDPQDLVMRFTITDSENTLDVIYRGTVSDSFEPGAKVALEGRYTADAVFEAQSVSSAGSSLCGNLCH